MKKTVSRNAKELARALNLDESVGVEWEMRFSLTQRIIEIVKRDHIRITEIAKKAETSRGRVTRILKGDTTGISLDVLARILGAVGQKAKITFSKSA
jgi:transcriptional regulator with XRE-family HTH domain